MRENKIVFILLMCFSLLIVLFFNVKAAFSAVSVVDKNYDGNPSSACTTGDSYHTTIQDAIGSSDSFSTVTVCPGTYEEYVYIGTCGLTLQSYTQDPSDTIIDVRNAGGYPRSAVLVLTSGACNDYIADVEISGFTIKGAVGGVPCNDVPPHLEQQPCAGIRAYCTIKGVIRNNIISNNNYGIIIKDTDEGWPFYYTVTDNEIHSNNSAGVKLHYGHYSYIRNNYIHDNGTHGIFMIDTWGNIIDGNIIEANHTGIELLSERYEAGEATMDNMIYHNNFKGNTVQAEDDASCVNPLNGYEHWWYDPVLMEGNYWDDYTGVDDGSGLGKHARAGDGIGDTDIPHPYPNDGTKCYDNYPYISFDFWVCTYPNTRIAGDPPDYYDTLQDAYDNAANGDTIESQTFRFIEDLNLNRDISVTLEGGYECGYSEDPNRVTIVHGSITISNGTVTIGRFVI